MVCSFISLDSSRSFSHSGTAIASLSLFSRTSHSVSLCHVLCSLFAMKRFAASECFVLIIRRLIFVQHV
ncbi:hypothetical protein Barb6_02910 [Bacteroidales bacterium Barb6]|nr:hypothetical protein Barb6_02910 [Bacteroidales bacterium Barb6]